MHSAIGQQRYDDVTPQDMLAGRQPEIHAARDRSSKQHEFAASVCSWPGRRVLADQRSFPKNNRTPISTLRSTLAWPARVGMRWPQVWHS